MAAIGFISLRLHICFSSLRVQVQLPATTCLMGCWSSAQCPVFLHYYYIQIMLILHPVDWTLHCTSIMYRKWTVVLTSERYWLSWFISIKKLYLVAQQIWNMTVGFSMFFLSILSALSNIQHPNEPTVIGHIRISLFIHKSQHVE